MDRENITTLVSIVMPVYNAERFLHASLDSILNQTYKNWELICADDGSKDNSLKILKSYAREDRRIRVIAQKENRGVSRTANYALSKTRGKLIARMDADDVMFPKRIEKQVKYLRNNPKTVAVGGQCLLIDEKGEKTGIKNFPLSNEEIYKMMYKAMPIQQPTLMINTNLLPKNFVWYENEFTTAEEVDLLFRLFKFGKIGNLPDFTIKYRLHGNNISLKDPKKTFLLTYQTRIEAIKKHGYRPTFTARIINYLQWLTIQIMPGVSIYPLFVIWRGVKPFKLLLPDVIRVKLIKSIQTYKHREINQFIGQSTTVLFLSFIRGLTKHG